MKKLLCLITCFAILAQVSVFAKTKVQKKTIVCTSFPQYDWVRSILGENESNFKLVLLNEKGVDLHSFQPSFAQVATIANADLVVYGGGFSEEWIEDVLEEQKNNKRISVNLMALLKDRLLIEEIVAGMQDDHSHDAHDHDDFDDLHDHDDDDENISERTKRRRGLSDADRDIYHHNIDDDDTDEYDEHIWLSLHNAKRLVQGLCNVIKTLDSANAAVYDKNCKAYCEKLDALDEEFVNAVNEGRHKTLLFADRFPFRYFVEDYGLEYFAAFPGCSAQSDARFETIIFLSEKIDALDLSWIIVLENSNQKLANTIKENTTKKNQHIVTLQSMQAVSKKDINRGTTYISLMQENLRIITQVLK